MANKNLVDSLNISKMTVNGKCKDCSLGHQTHCPVDGETEKDLAPLDLVAFNLWGPSHIQSMGGNTYMMVIVDAETSFSAYLPDKSDAMTIAAFDAFHTKAETTTGRKIH